MGTWSAGRVSYAACLSPERPKIFAVSVGGCVSQPRVCRWRATNRNLNWVDASHYSCTAHPLTKPTDET